MNINFHEAGETPVNSQDWITTMENACFISNTAISSSTPQPRMDTISYLIGLQYTVHTYAKLMLKNLIYVILP